MSAVRAPESPKTQRAFAFHLSEHDNSAPKNPRLVAAEQFCVLSAGGADAATAAVVVELADLVARGELEVPVAGVFPHDEVRDAFREVELRHSRGKLVLRP